MTTPSTAKVTTALSGRGRAGSRSQAGGAAGGSGAVVALDRPRGDHQQDAYEIPLSGRLDPASHDFLECNDPAVREVGRRFARDHPVEDRLRDVGHHVGVLEQHRSVGSDPLAVIITEMREDAHGLAGTATADTTWTYVQDRAWHDAVFKYLPGSPVLVEAGDGRRGGGGLHEDFVYLPPRDARSFTAKQLWEASEGHGPRAARFEEELVALKGGDPFPEIFQLRGTMLDQRTGTRSVCFIHFGDAAVPSRFFLLPLDGRSDPADAVASARIALLHAFRAVLGTSRHIGQCRRNAYLASDYISNPVSAPGSRELTFHLGGAIRLGSIEIPGQRG